MKTFIENKKLIYGTFGIIILAILGSPLYSSANQKFDISKLPDYYQNLAKECESKESYSCCVSSVSYMADGNYTLEPETGCPQGHQRNTQRCIDTFKWCEPINSATEFDTITLSNYNWEAAGSTINIMKSGKFSVESGRPGRMNEKEGKLTGQQIEELNTMLNKVNVFSLPDKYIGPRKTTRSWANYRLTIEAGSKSKSISFHSEDETAPQLLHDLAGKIEQFYVSSCVEDFTSCCVGNSCISNEIECAEGYISDFGGCDLEKCFPQWDCVKFDGGFYWK